MDDFRLNTIETDFRAEVLASGLINSGIEADKICMVRHKGDKKNISKDIDKVSYQYPNFDMIEYLYIFCNRESIYDSLPEGLFHHIASNQLKSKEAIVQEMKDQRSKEQFIRTFFQPFEMAIDKILIDAQLYEQKYDKACFHSNLTDILKGYWPILQYMSTGQALLFIRAIPMMQSICGNLDLTAKLMNILLNCSVSICEGGKSWLKLADKDTSILKDWRLGITSVLGTKAEYTQPDIVIHIGPLQLKQMRLFETNQTNYLILKELIALLMPFDRNVRIKYQTIAAETKFRLSGKDHTAYLGINTTL